jgi:YVTN family beta-propeller protein
VESVSVGSTLGMIASAPDSSRVYVTAGGDSRVYVVETESWTVTDAIDVGRGPDGLAVR